MTNIKTYNAISHKGLDYLAQHGYDINSTEQPKAILLRSQNLFDEVIPDTKKNIVLENKEIKGQMTIDDLVKQS